MRKEVTTLLAGDDFKLILPSEASDFDPKFVKVWSLDHSPYTGGASLAVGTKLRDVPGLYDASNIADIGAINAARAALIVAETGTAWVRHDTGSTVQAISFETALTLPKDILDEFIRQIVYHGQITKSDIESLKKKQPAKPA